ncbi:ribose-phosphate pyrophosphokinase 1 [Dorcoceras hygrometricum]|uniref:Ribose-phosphate pyrophosphokinase 1 n=1 Tax=Dorcoceras hygrometricum TaxID=472368 RepID=A0A2Z7AFW4_9LAMI|nr:ribose-phosphate pyrophosphokinase 1 [Dorcoceras hygrometricum]
MYQRLCELVQHMRSSLAYGSSELNLLRHPFFCNGKDPLEDLDYTGPYCNPIRQPSARRIPSHLCTPARKLACAVDLKFLRSYQCISSHLSTETACTPAAT